MKKVILVKSSIFAVAALVMGLGACKRGEQSAMKTEVPVKIEAGIDNAVLKNSVLGKASGIRDAAFNVGDEIGLYVVAYYKPDVPGVLENDGNYIDNAKSAKEAAAWTNTPAIFYPSVQADVYGYSPYSASFTPTATPDKYLFEVKGDQSDAAKVYANDFMTARVVKQAATVTPMPMTFFHRLSKLDVKFVLPATFKNNTITGVDKVTFKSFKNKAVVDLTSAYVYDVEGATGTNGVYPKPATADATSTLIDIQPNKVASGNLTTPYHYEALVVPQTMAADDGFVEVVVTYQGGGKETFTYKAAAAVTFAASKSTLLTLSFQNDYKILLGNVTIVGWTAAADAAGEVVEREVFNTFALTNPTAIATQVAKVEFTIEQGTGATPTSKTYTLPATHIAAATEVACAFNGTHDSPEYYPFKIKTVKLLDASNAVLVEKTLTLPKEVTATGLISITLN